jgi:aryl-alcohol dehydrogenase-like predicted oxidoreductase
MQNSTLPHIDRLGLGCSRLGSITSGADARVADTLINLALDSGIRHFDTADIYGQGDSERLLGTALRSRRANVIVATKIGQRFPLMKRILRPLKSPIIRLGGAGFRARASLARQNPLPRDYRPVYIAAAVEDSLRRLKMDYTDLGYLHSPSTADLSDGTAVGALEKLKREGKLRIVGVSCDDVDTARAALADQRVEAIQLPLFLDCAMLDDVLSQASCRGVLVVARSWVGHADGLVTPLSREERARRQRAAAARLGVSVVLVGTTSAAHLREAVEAAQ